MLPSSPLNHLPIRVTLFCKLAYRRFVRINHGPLQVLILNCFTSCQLEAGNIFLDIKGHVAELMEIATSLEGGEFLLAALSVFDYMHSVLYAE